MPDPLPEPEKPKTPRKGAPLNKKYVTWSSRRRYEEAIRLVLQENWPISEAAREVGVSRPRLSEKVKAARPEFEAKLAQLRQENVAESFAHAGLSPLGLQERRRVGTFQEFDDRYWSNWVCPDCEVHHERPGFHDEIVDALEGPYPRLVINEPPFHAKSTLATIKHTIYKLTENPNYRQIIISKSLDFARLFMVQIQDLLVNPDLYIGAAGNLIEDWGPFRGEDGIWNQNQIFVAGRITKEKDPTIQVLGQGNQIYGRRADDIKSDDVATLENQRNPDQVIKMIEWYDKQVLSRIGKKGKKRWIGTRVHAGDIYSSLQRRDGYKVLRYPTIQDDATESVLWPDHFPYSHALVLRTEMQPADWQLIYQNVDIPGLSASFTQEMIDAAKDTQRPVGHYDSHWRLIAGLDPAGGTDGAGYTAGVLLAVDLRTGKRFIVDAFAHKAMRAPQLKERIFDWTSRYPIYEWRVENNGLQSQLVQYNEEIIRHLALKGVRVQGHNTNTNKWDPQFGVESIAPLFNAGLLSIPWANASTAHAFQPLIEQLIAFPMGVVTDLVMALWFAELGVRDILRRAHLPMFDDRRPVPARIKRRRVVVDFNDGEVRRIPLHEQERRGGMTRGQMGYRRSTMGQPIRHSDVEETPPPEGTPYVNVAGNVGD